jgi:hypothetical protein
MNNFNMLIQHSEVLIRASMLLRQISNHLREGDLASAMELQQRYKSELEPVMEGLSALKKN